MRALRFLFIALLISVIPYSCSEEDNKLEEEQIQLLSSTRDSDKESSRPSFYQFDYISDYLGVKPLDDEEESNLSSQVLNKIYTLKIKGTLEYEITNLYGIPAWSLSRIDLKYSKDYVTVLTPIFDMDSQSCKATIVTKLGYDGELKKVHIYDQKKLSTERWTAFEPYFDELVDVIEGNENQGSSVFSRSNPCKQNGNNCWCKSDEGQCIVINGHNYVYCEIICPKSGGGGDGEEEAPSGTDQTEDGNINGTSSNSNWSDWDWSSIWPPVINPNSNTWNIFINNFNGGIIDNDGDNTFNFPEDGIGSDVADPNLGNENIMDPYELYYIQMQGFINHYNLTMTVDELAALLPNDPESCAGLLAADFYNCARYHLSSDLDTEYNLQLTENEKWYLFNNFEIYENITNFLAVKGNTAYARATTSIYLGLGDAALLDLTYSQAYSPENANKLKVLISDKLEAFGLDDQASVDPSTWFMMVKKQVSKIGGYFTDAFLEASEQAINEYWNKIVSPVRDIMVPILEEIGEQIPTTDEEWRALMAIFGPMLLELGVDVGTDFIPVVGELKALYKCGNAALEGNYGDAVVEFFCGLAGIIPIGDLLVKSGKITKAGAAIFTAFKVIKALSKVSKNIFSKLIEYAQLGWKIAWDSGLKKMTFKTGAGIKLGEINKDGVPNIIKAVFKSIVEPSTFKNLNPKPLTNTSSGNSISGSFINTNANKFNVIQSGMKSKFDDIVANGDQYGKKTEDLIREIIEDSGQSGFAYYDGSYNTVNGFDGVFIKGDINNPTEIIINESKQWTGGSVSLSGMTTTNPAQMTDQWVRKVAEELRNSNDPTKSILADAIEDAIDDGILTKVVTVIDRTPKGNVENLLGGINIIKVQ